MAIRLEEREEQQLDSISPRAQLTSRETEMILLMARGMLAKEIAHTLAISEKTVRNHISNIYRKLDIYDRVQLVIYAVKNGIVNISDI
ncbi:MAG: response regulator transcription factor [Chloroflexota bacterium]|nr:response regulator transcription factor [Chloroflexota bacterium]